MARFTRLEVLNTIINTGLVPVFYNRDVEVTKKVAWASSTGGGRLLEFTNRGDFAPEVFRELSRYCQRELPNLILGVGSILDAPTAALYVAYGANFVVGPNTNPEVARFSNRRKISYSPGCGSATEIAEAEELGSRSSRCSRVIASAARTSSSRSSVRVRGRASCRPAVCRQPGRA
jgi:2-dehydro-3-deoxyphosphogluconate aldolase/(4S)-4-hydroxy-2-oxoglutarate aldolase